MKENHKFLIWLILIFVLLAGVALVAKGVEGTPILGEPPPIPVLIPLEHNGEKGFWMNIEMGKRTAWAMSMISVYDKALDEADKAGKILDDALDEAINSNVKKDRKIENLERWKVGLLVANLFQAVMNAGGILLW